jgi:hypothetical protein
MTGSKSPLSKESSRTASTALSWTQWNLSSSASPYPHHQSTTGWTASSKHYCSHTSIATHGKNDTASQGTTFWKPSPLHHQVQSHYTFSSFLPINRSNQNYPMSKHGTTNYLSPCRLWFGNCYRRHVRFCEWWVRSYSTLCSSCLSWGGQESCSSTGCCRRGGTQSWSRGIRLLDLTLIRVVVLWMSGRWALLLRIHRGSSKFSRSRLCSPTRSRCSIGRLASFAPYF